MAVQPWESTQRHSELLEVGSFILHTFSHNLFFFLNKRTRLAMGCGDTDGNLEKSFCQNFSRRKLSDERLDDVRGEHPGAQWGRQGLLLRCPGHTAQESFPVRDRRGATTEDDGEQAGCSHQHSPVLPLRGPGINGAKTRCPEETATSISDPSLVRKRMAFLTNTRTKLNESHWLSKVHITCSSGDHIFQTWN